jgi:hypothetical protein
MASDYSIAALEALPAQHWPNVESVSMMRLMFLKRSPKLIPTCPLILPLIVCVDGFHDCVIAPLLRQEPLLLRL